MTSTRKRTKLENPMLDSRTVGWMLAVVGVALIIFVVGMLAYMRSQGVGGWGSYPIFILGFVMIGVYWSGMLAVLPLLFRLSKQKESSEE